MTRCHKGESTGHKTSLVDAHLGPFAQQVIAPHSFLEFGHDSSYFGDPKADLCNERSRA